MRIQINNKEEYNIDIDEQLTLQEFSELTFRFNEILRVFNKNNILNIIKSTKDTNIRKGNNKDWHSWTDEETNNLISIYNSSDFKYKEIADKMNLGLLAVTHKISNLILKGIIKSKRKKLRESKILFTSEEDNIIKESLNNEKGMADISRLLKRPYHQILKRISILRNMS